MAILPSAGTERMHCMEVWGGNSRVDRGFHTPGLEVWLDSTPYKNASNGGDVYYVSSCASGRITRLLLADVSGHGAAVASVSSGLRDLMRSNVNFIDQSRFVSEMNQQFADSARLEEFATAIACTFFSPTRSLQFCNAGHPIPFLYQAKQNRWVLASGAAQVEQPDGIADTPLGAINEAEYSQFEIKLDPGDMVMCVSDAFTESFDKDGHMLGIDGLLRLVRKIDVSRPEVCIRHLKEQVGRRQKDNLKNDDATVLLFRADGSSPSLTSDLLVPVRLLRGVRDSAEVSGHVPEPHVGTLG